MSSVFSIQIITYNHELHVFINSINNFYFKVWYHALEFKDSILIVGHCKYNPTHYIGKLCAMRIKIICNYI